jgi:hypothetical protein
MSTEKTDRSSIYRVKRDKDKEPFGAYFTTRLSGVNDKLVCALSAGPCYDYTEPDDGWDFNGGWGCAY